MSNQRQQRVTHTTGHHSAWRVIRILVAVLAFWSVQALSAALPDSSASRPRPETLARACSGCHSQSGGGLVRPLYGMSAAAFIHAMRDFKSGKRVSSIMNRIAKGYADVDILAMSEQFARDRQ